MHVWTSISAAIGRKYVDETLANDDAAVLGRALDFLEAEGYPILRDGK